MIGCDDRIVNERTKFISIFISISSCEMMIFYHFSETHEQDQNEIELNWIQKQKSKRKNGEKGIERPERKKDRKIEKNSG